jgi:argininosuccinate lyase
VLANVARAEGHDVRLSAADLDRALDPVHFISIRRTPGGPAPDVTLAAIAAARTSCEIDRARIDHERARIADGDEARRAAKAAL